MLLARPNTARPLHRVTMRRTPSSLLPRSGASKCFLVAQHCSLCSRQSLAYVLSRGVKSHERGIDSDLCKSSHESSCRIKCCDLLDLAVLTVRRNGRGLENDKLDWLATQVRRNRRNLLRRVYLSHRDLAFVSLLANRFQSIDSNRFTRMARLE